ncbi:hypothetical protein [Pseudorhodobacter wandonensis]|nr:hypothetical protein [Pseudorhodobacter wandonensis]
MDNFSTFGPSIAQIGGSILLKCRSGASPFGVVPMIGPKLRPTARAK